MSAAEKKEVFAASVHSTLATSTTRFTLAEKMCRGDSREVIARSRPTPAEAHLKIAVQFKAMERYPLLSRFKVMCAGQATFRHSREGALLSGEVES